MSTGAVGRWLETFMCKQYSNVFEGNGFRTLQQLCQLTPMHLHQMGVAPHDCEKILENVSVLRQTMIASSRVEHQQQPSMPPGPGINPMGLNGMVGPDGYAMSYPNPNQNYAPVPEPRPLQHYIDEGGIPSPNYPVCHSPLGDMGPYKPTNRPNLIHRQRLVPTPPYPHLRGSQRNPQEVADSILQMASVVYPPSQSVTLPISEETQRPIFNQQQFGGMSSPPDSQQMMNGVPPQLPPPRMVMPGQGPGQMPGQMMPGQMPGQGLGPMPGQMPCQMQGPMQGPMPGQMQGPMPGQMPGYMMNPHMPNEHFLRPPLIQTSGPGFEFPPNHNPGLLSPVSPPLPPDHSQWSLPPPGRPMGGPPPGYAPYPHRPRHPSQNRPPASYSQGPLQSLERLVMLPESQVVDPKSVVSEASPSPQQGYELSPAPSRKRDLGGCPWEPDGSGDLKRVKGQPSVDDHSLGMSHPYGQPPQPSQSANGANMYSQNDGPCDIFSSHQHALDEALIGQLDGCCDSDDDDRESTCLCMRLDGPGTLHRKESGDESSDEASNSAGINYDLNVHTRPKRARKVANFLTLEKLLDIVTDSEDEDFDPTGRASADSNCSEGDEGQNTDGDADAADSGGDDAGEDEQASNMSESVSSLTRRRKAPSQQKTKKKRGRPFGSGNTSQKMIDDKDVEFLNHVTSRLKSGKAGTSSLTRGPYVKLATSDSDPTVKSYTVVNRSDSEQRRAVQPQIQRAPTIDDKTADWICAFCGRNNDVYRLGDLYGPYKYSAEAREAMKKSPRKHHGSTVEFWVHEPCVVWTNGVYLLGNTVYGLEEALSLSKSQPCSVCRRPGATVVCMKRGCKKKFHYICALNKDCQFVEENFSIFCWNHKADAK